MGDGRFQVSASENSFLTSLAKPFFYSSDQNLIKAICRGEIVCMPKSERDSLTKNSILLQTENSSLKSQLNSLQSQVDEINRQANEKLRAHIAELRA